MTLTLTPELERFVRDEVKRKAFASSSEYIRTLVRERYARESEKSERLRALGDALGKGIKDAETGRVMPLDEAMRRLRSELAVPGPQTDG